MVKSKDLKKLIPSEGKIGVSGETGKLYGYLKWEKARKRRIKRILKPKRARSISRRRRSYVPPAYRRILKRLNA